jgi:hypothetical protein
VSGPNIVALSPDCTSVYAANEDDPSGITAFARQPACVGPAVTLTVSDVAFTSAKLGGTVDPINGPATAHFEYGRTTAYGSSTPTVNVPGDAAAHPLSAPIAGLTPATTYHARLVAVNGFGTTSPDQAFTTPALPPLVAKMGRVRVSKNKVRVTISCQGPAGGTCTGSLTLTVRARTKARGKLRTLTIGQARVKLSAGKSGPVTINLNSRGRSLLRKQTLKAKITLTVPNATGQPAAKSTKRVTMKRVRAKH